MPGAPRDPHAPPPAGEPSRRGTEPGPPPSKRAEMRDAVQDVMRKVQKEREQEMAEALAQHASVDRRKTRGIVLVVIGVALLVAAAWWALPRWQHPFAERSGAAADRDARIAIVFTAKLVDAFAARHQRLPHTLQETGVALPGITYVEGPSHYVLSAMVGDRRVEYVSTEDRTAFLNGR